MTKKKVKRKAKKPKWSSKRVRKKSHIRQKSRGRPSSGQSVPARSVAVGRPAPNVALSTGDGRTVKLSDFQGKKVVLYFYPKDDTPGCTREACAFRDGIQQIKAHNAEVIGVSVDSVDSHRRFKEKYQISFPLLADPNKEAVQAFGVWQKKSLYGRSYMGTVRTTFVIDEKGRIAKIFPQVKVDGHFAEVLEALS